jgi:hypothetical protein
MFHTPANHREVKVGSDNQGGAVRPGNRRAPPCGAPTVHYRHIVTCVTVRPLSGSSLAILISLAHPGARRLADMLREAFVGSTLYVGRVLPHLPQSASSGLT